MEHIMEMSEFLKSDELIKEAFDVVQIKFQEEGDLMLSTFANLGVKYKQHKITKIPKSIRVFQDKKGGKDYDVYYLEPKNDGITYYYKNHFGSKTKLAITDDEAEERKLGINKDGATK